MIRKLVSTLLLALAALGLPGAARAHLMPAGQGAVRVEAQSVFSVISIPVSALSGFDDDGDGLMSLAELNRHRPDLLRQVGGLIEFRADGQAGTRVFEDLLIPHLHEAGSRAVTAQLIAMQNHSWAEPIRSLTLRANLFAASPAPLALQAVRGGQAQTVVLTPHYNEHRFFQGPLQTLGRFVLIGSEHILLGLDHLLFLLTVLVAGAGWRYWATVVTSFTLAHSLTLTLASVGWIAVPASIAEPLIAASIVLMALDNLRRRSAGLGQRAALVFACGLVHGLGFASALQEMGGTGERWLPLLGFNLGVEAGQLLFVSAVLVFSMLVARVWPSASGARLMRVASVGAAGMGGVLLVQLLRG